MEKPKLLSVCWHTEIQHSLYVYAVRGGKERVSEVEKLDIRWGGTDFPQFTPTFGHHSYGHTMWHAVIPEFTASKQGNWPTQWIERPTNYLVFASCPLGWDSRRLIEGLSGRFCSADWKLTTQMEGKRSFPSQTLLLFDRNDLRPFEKHLLQTWQWCCFDYLVKWAIFCCIIIGLKSVC